MKTTKEIVQACIATRLTIHGVDFLETMIRNEMAWQQGLFSDLIPMEELDNSLKEVLGVSLSELKASEKDIAGCVDEEEKGTEECVEIKG